MGWFSKLFGGESGAPATPKIVVHEAFDGAIRVFEVPTADGWQYREDSRDGDGFSVMTLRYSHPGEPMPLVLMVKIYVLSGPAEAPEHTSWSEAFGPLFQGEPDLEVKTVEQRTMNATLPAAEAVLRGPARDVAGSLMVRERRASRGNEQFIVGAVGPVSAFEVHAGAISSWFETAVVVPYEDT